jgi:hypothetical protein
MIVQLDSEIKQKQLNLWSANSEELPAQQPPSPYMDHMSVKSPIQGH